MNAIFGAPEICGVQITPPIHYIVSPLDFSSHHPNWYDMDVFARIINSKTKRKSIYGRRLTR